MTHTGKKIRVSYSILSAWARGDFDRAVAPFVGGIVPGTEAMEDGKRYHEKWEAETLKTGNLPQIFGGHKLNRAKLEMSTKKEIWVTDWCQLSGILDVQDFPEYLAGYSRGIDYKRSKSTATTWANGYQHKVYQILYPKLRRFEYRVFDPTAIPEDPDRVTVAIIHLSDQTLQDGVEWVLTHASALMDYLVTNGYDKNLMREKIHGR